jgi:WD40 repeat protein
MRDGVELYSLSTFESLAVFRHLEEVRVMRFSPDGSQLLTANSLGNLWLWDTRSGQRLVEHKPRPQAQDFNPNDAQWSSDRKIIYLLLSESLLVSWRVYVRGRVSVRLCVFNSVPGLLCSRTHI